MAVTPVCSSIEELSKLEDTEFYNALIEYDLNQHVRDGHFLPDDRAVLFDVQKKIAAYHSGLCKDMFAISAAIDVETWQPDEGEEQLEDLQMMKQVLQRDMYILEGKWPTYRSLLAPIRWLPNEIIVNIFSYAIEDHAFNIDALALPACAKVCRRWYDIFSSSSQLWRSILVPEPLPCEEHISEDSFPTDDIDTSALALQIQRELALRLSTARDILKHSKQGLLSIELGPSWESCGFHNDKVAQFVLSQAHRCSRLVLRNIDLAGLEICITTMGEESHFPGWAQLRVLVIEVNMLADFLKRKIGILAEKHQLRTLILEDQISGHYIEDCRAALALLQIQNLSFTIGSSVIPTMNIPKLKSLTISLLQYYPDHAMSVTAKPVVIDVKCLRIFLHNCFGTGSFGQATFFLGTNMVSVTHLIIVGMCPQACNQNHSFYGHTYTSIRISDLWMTRLVAPSTASLTSVVLENVNITERSLIDVLSISRSLQELTYHQAANRDVNGGHDLHNLSDSFISWLTLSPWIPDVLPCLGLLDLKICTENLRQDSLVKMVGSRMEPRSMEVKQLRRFRLSIMGDSISSTAFAAFGEMRKAGLIVSVIDPEGLKL